MENENELEMPSRNSLQTLAMTAVYDVLTYIDMDAPVDIMQIVSSLCGTSYEDADYFVKANAVMTVKHLNEMKDAFRPFMKWRFERLPLLRQAILLLSYSHYYYVDPSVNKGVVIDIAVKLSKRYLGENDYQFVNAILDKVLQDRERLE